MKQSLSTLCQDFEKLFQMSTLKEFCICGEWLCCSEVKKAIVIGLQQQLQVASLERLQLRHTKHPSFRPEIEYNFSETEFKEFWSTVFSLPQADHLDVELYMEASIVLQFIDRVRFVSDCWKQFSLDGKKLKSLQLSLPKEESSTILKEDCLEPFKAVALDVKLCFESDH